jgi:hypothetical protein
MPVLRVGRLLTTLPVNVSLKRRFSFLPFDNARQIEQEQIIPRGSLVPHLRRKATPRQEPEQKPPAAQFLGGQAGLAFQVAQDV